MLHNACVPHYVHSVMLILVLAHFRQNGVEDLAGQRRGDDRRLLGEVPQAIGHQQFADAAP